MWVECGVQFRSNLVEEGGCIPLHAHSYSHIAMVTHGVFQAETTGPNGETDSFVVSSKDFDVPESRGYRLVIPKGWKHTFKLLQNINQPGEVLCFWPDGADQ
jgi:hypothetical protein